MSSPNFPSPLVLETCARAAHEMNRSYCIAIGDESQVHWEEAPIWMKESSRVGVFKALEGATPEQLHEEWTKYKLREGWKFGEKKDAEAKTHPCLVSYKELPASQRVKDALFQSTVLTMAEALQSHE